MRIRSIQPLQSRQAMTMLEFFVVVAVLAVLAGMLLPEILGRRTKCPPGRIKCVNHLKNVGVAFRIFAADNNDRFPMEVASTNGGSREFVDDPNEIWRHYLALSNELSTPQIVRCPNDSERADSTSFTTNAPSDAAGRNVFPFTGNTNISYFVGVDTTETDPQSLLAGDRNLTNNAPFFRYEIPAIRRLGTNHTAIRGAGFDHHIHAHVGNVLLGDGSVQQVNTLRLRQLLRESGDTNNRIAKP